MGINGRRRLRMGFISFNFKYPQKVIHLTYLRQLSWCEAGCSLEVSFPVTIKSLGSLDET